MTQADTLLLGQVACLDSHLLHLGLQWNSVVSHFQCQSISEPDLLWFRDIRIVQAAMAAWQYDLALGILDFSSGILS